MSKYKSHIIKPEKRAKRTILLKGPSGVGKTFQFRTLVEGGMRGLYACAEEHTGTLSDLEYDEWPLRPSYLDIPLMPLEKKVEKQDFMLLMDYLRSDEHDYDFVYLDSLMNYADELQNYLKYEKRLTGFEFWGMFGTKMKQLLKLLVSLARPIHPKPVHVIATWGVEISQDWEGKRAIVPVVDGKMVGPRIDYAFDDVLMLRKRENAEGVQYVAYTGGTHEFDAKVSSAVVKLPNPIADPNLFRILQKITGK